MDMRKSKMKRRQSPFYSGSDLLQKKEDESMSKQEEKLVTLYKICFINPAIKRELQTQWGWVYNQLITNNEHMISEQLLDIVIDWLQNILLNQSAPKKQPNPVKQVIPESEPEAEIEDEDMDETEGLTFEE